MNDFEADEGWLAKLGQLNSAIARSGEPLMGNLFYDHLQSDFASSPPNPILRAKRDRFREALVGRRRLLEIGVNGGHSAFLALSSNPTIEFHGVDIGEHAYTRLAVEWLKGEFPGRVYFDEGDCRAVLPRLARRGSTFDVFHVDGAKFTYFEDICNCQRMIEGDAVVVVDDTQLASVARVVERCLGEGKIEPQPRFPKMPPSVKYRNEIVALKRDPAWRSTLFRLGSPWRWLGRAAVVERLSSTGSSSLGRTARRVVSLIRHPIATILRRIRRRIHRRATP